MPTLRMNPDEAALLAAWIRIAAKWHDGEAARLGNTWASSSWEFHKEQAERIRRLADRLEAKAKREK